MVVLLPVIFFSRDNYLITSNIKVVFKYLIFRALSLRIFKCYDIMISRLRIINVFLLIYYFILQSFIVKQTLSDISHMMMIRNDTLVKDY